MRRLICPTWVAIPQPKQQSGVHILRTVVSCEPEWRASEWKMPQAWGTKRTRWKIGAIKEDISHLTGKAKKYLKARLGLYNKIFNKQDFFQKCYFVECPSSMERGLVGNHFYEDDATAANSSWENGEEVGGLIWMTSQYHANSAHSHQTFSAPDLAFKPRQDGRWEISQPYIAPQSVEISHRAIIR